MASKTQFGRRTGFRSAVFAVLMTGLLAIPAVAATKAKAAQKKPKAPEVSQTLTNVPYGSHPRQVLDFWKAASDKPTPLVFFIHGGGWRSGDKNLVTDLKRYLSNGISVVAINYRYTTLADAAGVKPPVKWPLEDAARALQFVRSKAGEWNIDKKRIGATGSSAGACSSLWLAFHDDMASPGSSDPVAKESTRLWCAAVRGAQTTLDPKQMKEWTPNSTYGAHAFGITGFDKFLEERERIMPWIRQYSPYHLVTPDDPPVYLWYSAPPARGQEQKDPTHSANFGSILGERLKAAGVPFEFVYPGADAVKYKDTASYFIVKLRE